MKINWQYFLDTSFILQKLRNNEIPQSISFLHFFIIMSFDWLQFTLIALNENEITKLSIFNSISTFIITITGLLYLYTVNGGANGKNFLEKFFALSVSVGWKFVVTSFLISYFISFIFTNNIYLIQVLSMIFLNLLMFFQIGKNLKFIL
jgi:hypothetical protein